MNSNGWTDGTAALQLFAHLGGGGPGCHVADAGGRVGKLGMPLARLVGLL